MTVQTILDYLWTLAPEKCKMPWDNVGHLLGRRNASVTRVLVALDATAAVVEEAAALGCELVVTHHPVIFHAQKHVNDVDPMTETALNFLERGIAVISMHTNLDCAAGGVNDVLAERLCINRIEILDDGETAGLIRMGDVAPTDLRTFAAFVKERLSCPGLRYADGGKRVRRVAVGGGACGDYLERVAEAGCDTFVTADLGYHRFCDAATLGLNLIDAGHFETETPICAVLRDRLAARFPELEVRLSAHTDCIRYL